jgi:hypothetical protein
MVATFGIQRDRLAARRGFLVLNPCCCAEALQCPSSAATTMGASQRSRLVMTTAPVMYG